METTIPEAVVGAVRAGDEVEDDFFQVFSLTTGAMFRVPDPKKFVYQRSRTVVNDGESGDPSVGGRAPMIARIVPSGSQWQLKRKRQDGKSGKVLFVPDGLKKGDLLQIVWVNSRSARAELATLTPATKPPTFVRDGGSSLN